MSDMLNSLIGNDNSSSEILEGLSVETRTLLKLLEASISKKIVEAIGDHNIAKVPSSVGSVESIATSKSITSSSASCLAEQSNEELIVHIKNIDVLKLVESNKVTNPLMEIQ